jgi:hypothetical protein
MRRFGLVVALLAGLVGGMLSAGAIPGPVVAAQT